MGRQPPAGRKARRAALPAGQAETTEEVSFGTPGTGRAYSLLSARIIASAGGNTEFADMRAAYDALDPKIKAEIEDPITEHW
jgi:alpha-ketoglutarate-dependent 2,4-dichlorophenoxyacetate dioxygenase